MTGEMDELIKQYSRREMARLLIESRRREAALQKRIANQRATYRRFAAAVQPFVDRITSKQGD